jgi:DNA repair photolyase
MDAPTHIHGRGTALNPANRFERVHVALDPEYFDPDEKPPATELYWDDSKSIISWNKSPDLPFEAGINPYRGCEHGCIYCYARPYHEYLGLSAGLDFETKLFVKRDAARLLRAEFMKPSWEPCFVMMSGVTDCYQPLEARMGITRELLQVFAEFRNPVGLITKNGLIARDLDLLTELAKHNCVSVTLSITTLDEQIRRVMEPRTSTTEKRFNAVKRLADAGVPVGVNIAPVIPGLTDQDIPGLVKRCKEAGARRVSCIPVRLPHAVGPMFEQWLGDHFPGHKDKVLKRIREMRGGNLNDGRAFVRFRGQGARADNMQAMFKLACKKYGFEGQHTELSTANFRRPGSTKAMFA